MSEKNAVSIKYRKLQTILKKMGRFMLAYSGGVDSTFLLKAARETNGCEVLPVTAVSETYTKQELAEAKKQARGNRQGHIIIQTEELKNKDFKNNPPERCYFCKAELFSKMLGIAKEKNIKWLADGANADDFSDFRPGLKAASEAGVRHPLAEAGFTKADVRLLSQKMGLKTWDKPAAACLASRIPYYNEITIKKLETVEKAENILKSIGLKQVRVRHYGDTARIEIDADKFKILLLQKNRMKIVNGLKKLGFKYITLDIEGFRSGSMNEVLQLK
jgi:uncharacterized protein